MMTDCSVITVVCVQTNNYFIVYAYMRICLFIIGKTCYVIEFCSGCAFSLNIHSCKHISYNVNFEYVYIVYTFV